MPLVTSSFRPRQPLQQSRREGRALAHDHQDLGLIDPGDESVLIGDVIGHGRDRDPVGQARPIGEAERGVLVIVEDQAGLHDGLA